MSQNPGNKKSLRSTPLRDLLEPSLALKRNQAVGSRKAMDLGLGMGLARLVQGTSGSPHLSGLGYPLTDRGIRPRSWAFSHRVVEIFVLCVGFCIQVDHLGFTNLPLTCGPNHQIKLYLNCNL